MSAKNQKIFRNVDELTAHVEELVEGWASVIRCKADHVGGAACGRVIMIVFHEFYESPTDGASSHWTSDKELVCDTCARDLNLYEA